MPFSGKAFDLRLAIIVLVLAPLLLVFGGGGLLALAALERTLEERMQEDISLIARTLRQPMSRALERDREGAMNRALRSASDFGRVYGVYLYDADGRLLTQVDKNPGNSPTGAASELHELRDRDTLGDYRSIGGEEVFSLFTPLTDAGGQVIGMLQITRQVSEMRDYLNGLRLRVLPLLLVFGMLFVIIVIAGHGVAIGGPLRRLTDGMERISAGERDARPAPGGPREIRRLGERFNAMLDGISERDAHLEEQRRNQQRLADRLRQTEKYALAGRLAAGVAHELGTPLSVVDGHVQRLLRRQAGDDDRRASLHSIREAAQRMTEVVQHLLGFGRGSSTDLAKIPVARLLALAAADSRSRFEASGTELLTPSGPPNARILADESRLREALGQLLRNAEHSASGGRVMLTSSRTDDGGISIRVEDSGKGIAAEDRERVFEPFYTTKAPGQGSGLGLAVVRGIVADHHASLDIYRSSLGGAGFRIDFPGGLQAS